MEHSGSLDSASAFVSHIHWQTYLLKEADPDFENGTSWGVPASKVEEYRGMWPPSAPLRSGYGLLPFGRLFGLLYFFGFPCMAIAMARVRSSREYFCLPRKRNPPWSLLQPTIYGFAAGFWAGAAMPCWFWTCDFGIRDGAHVRLFLVVITWTVVTTVLYHANLKAPLKHGRSRGTGSVVP